MHGQVLVMNEFFQGGYFFEEGPGSIQSQEHDDTTLLTLGSSSELSPKKINTTGFIVLEILLLVRKNMNDRWLK